MSKTIRTIDSQPREMYEAETIERFKEGLLLSISCCKEMNQNEPNKGWYQIGEQLMALRLNGIKQSQRKAITRGALLQDAAILQRSLDTSVTA
jgi:hypothetical protein